MLRASLLTPLLLAAAPICAEPIHAESLKQQVARIARQQEKLAEEIQVLERLLGVVDSLGGLEPMAAPTELLESTQTMIRKGIEAFQEQSYDVAKERFQEAWEEAPESAVTNFNLGLIYHQLGKTALSKRFLKSALDQDPKIKGAEEIRTFLAGDLTEELQDTERSELLEARTEMINLKKQASSYLNSKSMTLPKRLSHTCAILRKMEQKSKDNPFLIQDYFRDMADTYASMEMYDQALSLLHQYEEGMRGKILPDGYHADLLRTKQKQQEQTAELARYLGNTPSREIGRKLTRDLKELSIFARQLDEFVADTDGNDRDFTKLCQRLGEYRWGDRPGRHVLVFSRFQELLWSSLQGTVPLDRYQDSDGNRFFKDIALLADTVEPRHAEFVQVSVPINGQQVPYVLMFAYSAKHEAFIVVRLPERDLA